MLSDVGIIGFQNGFCCNCNYLFVLFLHKINFIVSGLVNTKYTI